MENPWRSLKTRVTVISSLIWLASLWLLAFTMGAWQQRDLRKLLGASQYSTATIIADQIRSQLNDRILALEATSAQVSAGLLGQPAELQTFLASKAVASVLFNSGCFVTGTDGVALASVPLSARRQGVDFRGSDYARRTLGQGTATIGEVTNGTRSRAPTFAVAVPIKDDRGAVIGMLAGVTDLSRPNFLDRINENTLGRTGGFLLVAARQRLIVTASDKTRIREKLADPGVNLQIDRYLAGWEGSDVLINPKGVEVLAAVRQIPEAGWYVAAATPTTEAFQPVADLTNRMVLIATLLTLATGTLNWFVLKRQLTPVTYTIQTLSDLSESDGPLAPLPVSRNDEIGALIESFNRLLRALEKREEERSRYEALASQNQRLESLGLLAGGLAHDFNNLLAGIFGNIELALLVAPHGPGSTYLTKTLDTLDRARGLTRQLLTFSKGGEPDLRTGELFPFLEETARFALSGSSVSCRVDVEPGLWACRFDRAQIGQVTDNLVINALQAMPRGGSLTITAANRQEPEGRFVEVVIQDSGVGMTADVLSHVFDPFFSTKAQGHGLGLTTCYSIIHKHGGTMGVTSEVGRGARFWFRLPASEAGQTEVELPAGAPHQGNGTVLVMDDEPEVADILAAMLRSFGYQVLVTASGEAALAAFERERGAGRPLAAAILDLTVPGGLGGAETAQRLWALEPTLPVIVASGFSEAPVLATPHPFGFVASLRKPYLRADLEAALRHLPRASNDG